MVNSDSTLKAQLIEFRDHKLITSKKVIHTLNSINIETNGSFFCQSTLEEQLKKSVLMRDGYPVLDASDWSDILII